MKSLIATSAVLILLVIFPLQTVLDQINHKKLRDFDEIVHNACEQARTDGRFTPENIENIKKSVTAKFHDISEGDISINVTTEMKYRLDEDDEREHINYEIKVPLKKIVAGNLILGISDADNQVVYTQKGYVLSEVPMP